MHPLSEHGVLDPSPSPSSSPAVTLTRPEPVIDQGDHERMAHIVLEGYTPEDGEFV